MEWAEISSDRFERVEHALDKDRQERARRVNDRVMQLREHKLKPSIPVELRRLSTAEGDQPVDKPKQNGDEPKPVRAIKVDEKHDQHKREVGDEGERWALAAVVDALLLLDDDRRDAALEQIKALLLKQFRGRPIDMALAHYDRARLRDLDPEERIEELSGLLHVSRYSDAFGFDMVGWLASGPGDMPQAVCLEVKSSRGEAFQLSRGEWSEAERFHGGGIGSQYAILVVRRGKSRSVPDRMDLLSDPVELVGAELLMRKPNGYQMTYEADVQ